MPFVELLRRPVVWAGAASAAMVLFLLLRPSSPAISPVVWTEASANLPPEGLQPGAAAPDFVLPTVEGGTVALGGLQGKSGPARFCYGGVSLLSEIARALGSL